MNDVEEVLLLLGRIVISTNEKNLGMLQAISCIAKWNCFKWQDMDFDMNKIWQHFVLAGEYNDLCMEIVHKWPSYMIYPMYQQKKVKPRRSCQEGITQRSKSVTVWKLNSSGSKYNHCLVHVHRTNAFSCS